MNRVVVVKRDSALGQDSWEPDDYYRALEAGLVRLCAADSTASAVRKLLPAGPIGMKTNCLVGKPNSTPTALVDGVARVLNEAGFDDSQIVVWDRTSRELAGAGFELNASTRGRRCLGTDANGVGYSSSFYSYGKVDSLVSRIMTIMVAANINLPVLKDHSIAGLSGGMKNMYGAIHNPNKYHADNCNPFCAHVSCLEPIKEKNKLTVMDAVHVQYDGGPGFMGQYRCYYGGVIMSDDPVAADRVGLEILTRLRADHRRPPLEAVGRGVKYLATAEEIGLGTADMSRIELTVLEFNSASEAGEARLF